MVIKKFTHFGCRISVVKYQDRNNSCDQARLHIHSTLTSGDSKSLNVTEQLYEVLKPWRAAFIIFLFLRCYFLAKFGQVTD